MFFLLRGFRVFEFAQASMKALVEMRAFAADFKAQLPIFY
jgi:hypothetical protein